MRLRNKKTGEMGIINYFDNQSIVIYPIDENWNAKGDKKYVYHSLAELNEEWEDYEDPKEYWYVEPDGSIIQNHKPTYINHLLDGLKSIGNYFETREEAEKAVEKLKAWKRLKDKGFRFLGDKTIGEYGSISYCLTYPTTRNEDADLDLLFGGEE